MKRIAKVLLCTVLLLALANATKASADPQEVTITRMSIIAELFENTSVKVTVNAELSIPSNYSGTVRSIIFPIIPIGISMESPSKGISSVKALSQDISAQRISTESFGDAIVINFEKNLKAGTVRNISFSFTLTPTTALAKFDDSYRFAYRFYKPNVTLNYNKSIMEAILPRGAGVTKISQDGALSMDPLSERLVAIWVPFPSPRGGGWDFVIEFKMIDQVAPQQSIPQTGSIQQQNMTGLIFPLVISNAITASITFAASLLLMRRQGKVIPIDIPEEGYDEETLVRVEEALEKLDRDERDVIDIIYRNNGKIEQKDLPELTGFSKSKVSRILKRLDSMGFVRRVSQGKTKIVELNPALNRVLRESSEGAE
jgi:uncharacterized membrane protein